MKSNEICGLYQEHINTKRIAALLQDEQVVHHVQLKGMMGSSAAFVGMAVSKMLNNIQFFIFPDKETAAYFFNDIEALTGEQTLELKNKKVLFYPASNHTIGQARNTDNTDVLIKTDVLNKIRSGEKCIVVSYAEAICEKVISGDFFVENTLKLKVGERVSIDFINELLMEYHFERVDFVIEPGQYTIRGGIIDVFSYANENPYRIEFFGDDVESIRTFDPVSQLSLKHFDDLTIIPSFSEMNKKTIDISLFKFIPEKTILWMSEMPFITELVKKECEEKIEDIDKIISFDEFTEGIQKFSVVETGKRTYFEPEAVIEYNMVPQPVFNKNFDLLIANLEDNLEKGFTNIILADNRKQLERIHSIITDIRSKNGISNELTYSSQKLSIHEGFIDNDLRIALFTDHQIFERHHNFRLRDSLRAKEAITLKELYNLKKGDYITHIDHGIGIYDGLEKIEVNGKQQETIRLIYKDNDILYISIHSLHRIAKYVGKEGTPPAVHRLGSSAWNKIKEKTKQKVKDIARDLIQLYAKRKSAKGYAFSGDSFMQYELEASFIYEDTPDQLKANRDVKRDMEAEYPMDRLVCGDVGFGKTEIAVRAAFKAVADSKQVAVLVPTTILALQHYKTFSERLKEFPCKVEYINRFKSAKQQKEIIRELKEGKIDIIIGTHRIISKDIQFKDIGLLIVDEEQKFGVSTKEKLKQIKVNVDTLTLTATPIPRTLQFSLMGARDLSIINTPPPNRYPIQTELHPFNEDIIRDAINHEYDRGGQVFVVHNRVQNISYVAEMIQRLCPEVRITIGHGQMEGHELEKVMMEFINGQFDVLVATTIIESGLDIPNVNTIIIHDAHKFGLSDLHQLRGRVGRTNKKAFCYLIAPPLTTLSDESRKRLKAIEEFSGLGSGFNIAMRDLDIRGAGNILGAEQSGFITEIGYETYQKILEEALHELKEQEFKGLYENELKEEYVKDCVIETDLELLIPDYYVNSISERLSLYKELDNIDTEENLVQFGIRLSDRFGAVPKQTEEMFKAIRLRKIAARVGLEKIVLKKGIFIATFIGHKDSSYFQSEKFNAVLSFLQKFPIRCRLKEKADKLTLIIDDIKCVDDAMRFLSEINI